MILEKLVSEIYKKGRFLENILDNGVINYKGYKLSEPITISLNNTSIEDRFKYYTLCIYPSTKGDSYTVILASNIKTDNKSANWFEFEGILNSNQMDKFTDFLKDFLDIKKKSYISAETLNKFGIVQTPFV